MKIRLGFVSNSSSASFVIKKDELTPLQLDMIRNGTKYLEIMSDKDIFNFYHPTEYWNINEDENNIYGNTLMDNFDMSKYLEYIGISSKDIKWENVIGTYRYGKEALNKEYRKNLEKKR